MTRRLTTRPVTTRRAGPVKTVPVLRREPAPPPDVPPPRARDLHHRSKWAVPVNPMAVGMDWGLRGFSCQPVSDPAGKEWRECAQDADLLITVIEGRLEIAVLGATIDAMPGDEVIVPRETMHAIRNPHHARTRWLYGYNG